MSQAIETAGEAEGKPPRLPVWPVTAALAGFPIWWLLGASWAAWPVGAFFMLGVMVQDRRVRLPRGSGMWLLFLCANVVSLAVLSNTTGLMQWLYYMSSYLAATVMLVYIYNVENGPDVVAKRIAAFWAFIIVCGLVGLLLPNVQFEAPLGLVTPQSLADNPVVKQFTTIDFSSEGNFLGVPRPSAPFIYANRWGFGVLLTLPAALYTLAQSKGIARAGWTVLLLLSIVPIVFSLNRGLWAGVVLLAAYMAGRAVKRRQGKWVIALFLGVVVATASVLVTPLGGIINAKIASDYSTNARFAVYTATWDAFKQSPIFGHGTSGSSVDATVNGISIGSQGHFWTLLYSGGLVTTVPFLLWLGLAFPRTHRRGTTGLALAFRLPLLIALPMMLVYAFVPDGMALVAICYGAAMAAVDGQEYHYEPGSAIRGGAPTSRSGRI